jgi:hypothetical protein
MQKVEKRFWKHHGEDHAVGHWNSSLLTESFLEQLAGISVSSKKSR